MTRETISLAEFHGRLKAQDVPRTDLAFICPSCGTVQSLNTFRRAGVEPERAEKRIGFACVGRDLGSPSAVMDKASPRGAQGLLQPAKGCVGCDWSLGGLLHIHELEVLSEEEGGQAQPSFAVADADQARILAAAGGWPGAQP